MKKQPNPKCPNCNGRGHNLYADSWDSDNYTPCLTCFPEPIVSIEIGVFKDKVSSEITCGKGKSFNEVLKGLKAAVKELQDQIKRRKQCPMYESDKS
jgi:hypothetical protein